ncbi:MAG: hypothetical protein ABI429_10615 [Jatrophihabitantaceae bacterium]
MTSHNIRWLLAACAAALLLAGCSKPTSGTGQQSHPAPTGNSGPAIATTTSSVSPATPTATGIYPTSGPCPTTCVSGDDGMQYRIISTRRFIGLNSTPVVAVGFSMTNQSSVGHDFDATGGGFSAVLSSGGVVQIENELSAAGAGDPRCYTNPLVFGGGSDPNIVHVNPGSTFVFPKQICLRVTPPDKITEIEFADQDASNAATVTLPNPI